jgi:hypothetical protein
MKRDVSLGDVISPQDIPSKNIGPLAIRFCIAAACLGIECGMGVLGSNSRHIVQTLEGGVRRIRIDNARHACGI